MASLSDPFDAFFQRLSTLSVNFTPTVWSDLPKDVQNYFLKAAAALAIDHEAYKRATYHTIQLADLPEAVQDYMQQNLPHQISSTMFVSDGVLILTRDILTAWDKGELGYAGADPSIVAVTNSALDARDLTHSRLTARSIVNIAAEVATASISAAAAAAPRYIETGKRARMVKMARVGTMVRMGKGKMLRRASRVGKVVRTVTLPRV